MDFLLVRTPDGGYRKFSDYNHAINFAFAGIQCVECGKVLFTEKAVLQHRDLQGTGIAPIYLTVVCLQCAPLVSQRIIVQQEIDKL